MGFLSSVKESLGSAVGGGIGGMTSQFLGNAVFGGPDIRKGHKEDNRAYAQRQEYDWGKAEERGLTPQEFYGSPASGGSGPTGGANVLGNQQTAERTTAVKAATAAIQADKDRQVQLRGQDTQKEIAEIQAGQQRYNTDTQAAIAENRLALDRDTYKFINLPTAASKIGKTEKETQKIINEIATSEKDFVLYMKKLSMGVDNMLSEMYQSMNNFDVTKPQSLKKFTPEQRQALLAGMLALQSQSKKEISGITDTLGKAGNTLLESLSSIVSNPLGLHKPIERAPGLGRKFKPPKSYKKPGVATPQPFMTY